MDVEPQCLAGLLLIFKRNVNIQRKVRDNAMFTIQLSSAEQVLQVEELSALALSLFT